MRSLRWSNQDHFDWRNDLAESMVHSALTVDLATPIGVSAETRVAVELGEAGSHGLTQWCCRSGKELQLRWARSQLRWVSSNNRSERSRGRVFGEPRREVDDEDKTASFVAVAPPRRSTSSLDDMRVGLPVDSSAVARAAGPARCISRCLRHALTPLVESGPLRLAKRFGRVNGALRLDRRPRDSDRRFRGNAGCRRIG
jgi:hypothetical protein